MDAHLKIIQLIVAYTCVGVFVATAIATVLNVFGLISLEASLRKKLHTSLILEIAAIAVAAFAGLLNPKPVVEQVRRMQEEIKPRVFIHIADEAQRPAMVALQKQLQSSGYLTPGIENVKGKSEIPKRPNVRYFNDEDKVRAEELVQKLKLAGFANAFPYRVSMPARAGSLEVWLPSP
jgi:hypothetical protein